jgi:hypothetical protein
MNHSYCDVGNILLNGSTDKNTVHQYGISYNLIFNSQYLKLNRSLKVLEIGISMFGEGSVGPFSEISYVEKYVGLDNQTYRGTIPNDKVKLYAGPEYDAYSPAMLDMLKEKEGLFDIIIDDGPHSWPSQDWFFRNYYSLLNEGGVLVCEDIHEMYRNNLAYIKKELGLYILDLRFNASSRDEIIGLRFK